MNDFKINTLLKETQFNLSFFKEKIELTKIINDNLEIDFGDILYSKENDEFEVYLQKIPSKNIPSIDCTDEYPPKRFVVLDTINQNDVPGIVETIEKNQEFFDVFEDVLELAETSNHTDEDRIKFPQ